jgi:pyrimidine operon attenuation protein / uracil phosphoribosyltransferase
MSEEKQILFEKDELGRAIRRMAHELIEKTTKPDDLVLIGIRSRGVYLARRMARQIQEMTKVTLPVGVIDVTPYRDDRSHDQDARTVSAFEVQVGVDDKTVVLIDDVIFRGRTIRAAMDAVARLGQPKRILVAALIDRGSRELPIRADVVGKNIEAGEGERVNVMLEESDGVDQVSVTRWQSRKAL